MIHFDHSRKRRRFLAGLAGLSTLPLLPLRGSDAAQAKLVEARLVAGPARVQVAPSEYPSTGAWTYNGSLPGPVLRVRQGDRLRVHVENALAEPTTVHWHGIRLPNAMDGVPYITQRPIEPGKAFTYEFALPDAGTFFYHPHQRGYEQVGRGLAGALIVEERTPPEVDRDILWVLGDYRLSADAAISGGFGNFMDVSHAGRIGNTVTLNGRVQTEPFRVRAGERIRLRLVNAASARVFALEFRGHEPWVVALDGQPVEPHRTGGAVALGPAMRADLILDMTAAPGSRHAVIDGFYRQRAYTFNELQYSEEAPLRARPADPPRLPPNPLAEPDIRGAERHQVVFTGGMMGGMGGMMGGMRGGRSGMAWAVNGVANSCGEGGLPFEPLLVLRKGRSCMLDLVNDTAWHHPIHLHGHSFRVLSRNGRPTPHREWLDTVMLDPRERAEIAFVADNPGDWMFHCHVLEHQAGGMMSCIRVA